MLNAGRVYIIRRTLSEIKLIEQSNLFLLGSLIIILKSIFTGILYILIL
jgi:hypothetical protein